MNLAIIAVAAAFTAAATAQPITVVGTGDPTVDIPAVQAAVDQGGQVVLMGKFSFDAPPTQWIDHVNGRTILVSKQVEISGALDANGDMPTITGGNCPFAVDALGFPVAIRRLHFVRSKEYSIIVRAVSGLVVANCKFEGIQPLPDPATPTAAKVGNAIHVVTTQLQFPPTTADPGTPENISGTLLISGNDIDLGGTASENTVAISVFAVGKSPDLEVDLSIFGNNIRNITERVISADVVGGRVHIERNMVATGKTVGPPAGVTPDMIHAVGPGSFLIAHNTLVSEWATGAGIRVQGNAGFLEAGAIVVDNDLTMTAPDATVFGANSAAIEIRGQSQGNVVANNRIQGRARAALAVVSAGNGIHANNTFVSNNLDGFQSSMADVVIDAGVTGTTLVVGPQASIQDNGTGTAVIRTP